MTEDQYEIAYAAAMRKQAAEDMKAYQRVQARRNAAWDRTGLTGYTSAVPKLHPNFTNATRSKKHAKT